jgi:hypothetical protein
MKNQAAIELGKRAYQTNLKKRGKKYFIEQAAKMRKAKARKKAVDNPS